MAFAKSMKELKNIWIVFVHKSLVCFEDLEGFLHRNLLYNTRSQCFCFTWPLPCLVCWVQGAITSMSQIRCATHLNLNNSHAYGQVPQDCLKWPERACIEPSQHPGATKTFNIFNLYQPRTINLTTYQLGLTLGVGMAVLSNYENSSVRLIKAASELEHRTHRQS